MASVNQIISLDLTQELAVRLDAYVTEHDSNRSALIRKAIVEYLDKKEKK
jgi:metal-responsive CopG/Arc/MetJ family transcriptional regulator